MPALMQASIFAAARFAGSVAASVARMSEVISGISLSAH
jgi:hypothetical protein